jgi:hypothetical protein
MPEITSFIPTLIVGIGGTGSKTINQLIKKTRDQQFVSDLEKAGLFSYIALDTDSGEQNNLDLDESAKILISENVSIKSYSNMRRQADEEKGTSYFSWMPPESEVGPGFYNFNIEGGAGQLRLYSRLAFEVNSERIYIELGNVISKLNEINRERLTTKNRKINVYLICSIAGGTGSGSFLHTAATIKKICVERNIDVYVNGVFLTPDIYKKGGLLPAQQHANLDANGFACIKEIEAFNRLNMASGHKNIPAFAEDDMVFQFLPHKEPITHDQFGRRPIDNVYLIEATNQNGGVLRVRGSFDAYEKMVADALYCLIFSPIGTRATSTLNNTSTANLEANRPYYLSYGSFGSGRIVFPIKDIARFCAYKFAEEIVCNQWQELEKDYDQQIAQFEQARQEGNFDVEEPMRHKVFIKTIETQATQNENCPPEIRYAKKQYDYLTAADSKYTDKGYFADFVVSEIVKYFNDTLTSSGQNNQHSLFVDKDQIKKSILDEIRLDLRPSNPTNNRIVVKINNTGLLPILSRRNKFSDRFNSEYFSNVVREVEEKDALLSRYVNRPNEDKLAARNALRRLVLENDPVLRANPSRLKGYQLIKYLTFSEEFKDRNLFFIRYFLSKELDRFDQHYKAFVEQRSKCETTIKNFRQQFENRKSKASGKTIHYTEEFRSGMSTIVRNWFGISPAQKLLQQFKREYPNYYNAVITKEILSEALEIIKRIMMALSYDKFKGEHSEVGGSGTGLLQFFHEVTDYIRKDMTLRFRKEAEEARRVSLDAPLSGYSIKGVYHSPESKDNIWKNHMLQVGRASTSKIIETQQAIMDEIESKWRRTLDDEGRLDKEQLLEQKILNLKELKNSLIEKTIAPSYRLFEDKLSEQYDIVSAMQEEIYEVHFNKNIQKDDPRIMSRIEEEIMSFYSGIAPFAKMDMGEELQQINVAAYSGELESKYGLAGILSKASQGNKVQGVPLDAEDRAHMENKNEILFLRMLVSGRVDRFPNIKGYRAAYDASSICRHLDYNWTFRLPEFIREDEEEFYLLFALAELEGFIVLRNEPIPGEQQIADASKVGAYIYYEDFFDGRTEIPQPLRVSKDSPTSYKHTIWGFRKMLNSRRQFDPKSYKAHLLALRDNIIAEMKSGRDTKLNKIVELYNDYQQRLQAMQQQESNSGIPILKFASQVLKDFYVKTLDKTWPLATLRTF